MCPVNSIFKNIRGTIPLFFVYNPGYTRVRIFHFMKTAVLLSGGVDSSVALSLLKKEKKDITAFYLKIWLEDELSFLGECPWEEDLSYARKICEKFDVPLEIIPFQKQYWDNVVSYTIKEVQQGRTPNPDMLCNKCVKFGLFADYIDSGFDRVATGHYAQVEKEGSHFYLKKSPDPVKDQTYFLSQLSQEQLQKALFPIGHLTKRQVRALALQHNLPTAHRKDSQGICFLGKIPYDKFLEYHLGIRKGDLIEYETGKKLGEHNGFWYLTIGQRKGIHLSGGPYYVVAKDTARNIVTISKNPDSTLISHNKFIVADLNWFFNDIQYRKNIKVKIRHGPTAYPCTIQDNKDGTFTVQLQQKDKGIAPGQFAVFYDSEVCLGGGTILTSY